MPHPTSFAADIRPLFTPRDIQGMSGAFDLADYEAVKAHAQAIHDRIRGVGDGPWLAANIALFDRWIADGCPP